MHALIHKQHNDNIHLWGSNLYLCFIADVDVDKPDEKSIMTYVAQFLKHYPDPHHHQSETDGQQEEVRFSAYAHV